jgi:ankyrin repeat protein
MDGGLIPRLQQENYDNTLTRLEYRKDYLPLLTIVSFPHNLVDTTETYYLWKTDSTEVYKLNYDFTVNKVENIKEYTDDMSNSDFYNFNEKNLQNNIKITETVKIPYHYFLTQRVKDVLQVAIDYTLDSDYLQKIFRFHKETHSIITISGLLNPLNLFIFIGKFPKLIEILELDKEEIIKELNNIFTITNEEGKYQLNNIYDLYTYYSIYIKARNEDKSKIDNSTIYGEVDIQQNKVLNTREKLNFEKDIKSLNQQYIDDIVKEILELKEFLNLLKRNTEIPDFDKMFLMSFFYYRLQKKELLGGFPINLQQQLDSLIIEQSNNNVDNIYNQKKPLLYEYSMTNYGGETYGNCMENTILQFIKILLWNPDTMKYEEKPIINDKIKEYINKVYIIEQGINQKNQINIDKWTSLITPIPGLEYFRKDKELNTTLSNFNRVLEYIFGKNIENIKDLNTNIKEIIVEKKNKYADINIEGSDEKIQLYEGHARFVSGAFEIPYFNNVKTDLIYKYSSNDSTINKLLEIKDKKIIAKYASSKRYLINRQWENALVYMDSYRMSSNELDELFKYIVINSSKIYLYFTDIEEEILLKVLDKNIRDLKNSSLLHYFIYNIEIVKELIDIIDINVKDDDNFTPLIKSFETDSVEITKLLLDKGADINIKTINNITALYLAVNKINTNPLYIDIVKMILEKNININEKFRNNKTILYIALEKKMIDIAKMILEKNPDVNIIDKDGISPLYLAVLANNMEIIKLLLSKGADINSKDNNNTTILHIAVFDNNTELVKILLDMNININIISREEYDLGKSRINNVSETDLAIINNNLEIIELLLQKGGIISNYYDILKHINSSKSFDILKLLLKYDDKININRIILISTTNNYLEIIMILYENGKIRLFDIEDFNIIKYLIEKGANVNEKNQYGDTILYNLSNIYIRYENHSDYQKIKYLLEKGADIYEKNSDGKSTLEFIEELNNINLIRLFSKYKQVGGDYYQKYLKYKQKYLELKNKI